MIVKVISGGQTGVDQAALHAAIASGLKIGGWAPPDNRAEDGPIPAELCLQPTNRERHDLAPHVPRSERTALNVRDSDGTVILSPTAPTDPGTQVTIQFAEYFGKPLLILHTFDPSARDACLRWIEHHQIKTLNVAGPSLSNWPEARSTTQALLSSIFALNERHA